MSASLNKENLNILINHLEKMPKEAFDMGEWMATSANRGGSYDTIHKDEAERVLKEQETAGHTCGTVACIAGYATTIAVVNGFEDRDGFTIWDVRRIAKAWLGLNEERADRLFTPDADHYSYTAYDENGPYDEYLGLRDLTHEDGLEVLRGLRDRNRIDWDRIMRKRAKELTKSVAT